MNIVSSVYSRFVYLQTEWLRSCIRKVPVYFNGCRHSWQVFQFRLIFSGFLEPFCILFQKLYIDIRRKRTQLSNNLIVVIQERWMSLNHQLLPWNPLEIQVGSWKNWWICKNLPVCLSLPGRYLNLSNWISLLKQGICGRFSVLVIICMAIRFCHPSLTVSCFVTQIKLGRQC